jgi:hypothetical protein
MRRRKLEGFKLGRQPLDIDHGTLVQDRRCGMSLTQCATKYGVSRASVVRFVRTAQISELNEFVGLPSAPELLAAVECVA